jgi:hypothetical protein
MVSASLKYSDWESPRGFEAGAGPLIFGRRQPEARFPGDRRPTEDRLPQPPRAPESTPGGVEREEPQNAPDAAVENAFPDGHTSGPTSGYLYFAFKGKAKSIKSLELICRRGEQQTQIRFF